MQYELKNVFALVGFCGAVVVNFSACHTVHKDAPIAFLNAQEELNRTKEVGTINHFPNSVSLANEKFEIASAMYEKSLKEKDEEKKSAHLNEATSMAEESYSLAKNANSLATSIPLWDSDINYAASEVQAGSEAITLRQKVAEMEVSNEQLKQQVAGIEAFQRNEQTGLARVKDFRFNGSVAFFPSSSSALEPQYLGRLEEIADSLRQSPGLVARISAYTDNTGRPEFNEPIKLARAESVKSVFISRGVPEKQVEVNLDTESSAQHTLVEGKLQLQRRVDIEIMPRIE